MSVRVRIAYDDAYHLIEHKLDDNLPTRELTAEEWADYQRVQAEYDAWQDRIDEMDRKRQ